MKLNQLLHAILVVAGLCQFLQAQPDTLWTKTLDGSVGNSIQQTTDNGYIIVGSGGSGILIIKTNANGDTLWTRTFTLWKQFGDVGSDQGFSVQQTNDGGYIIAGETYFYVSPWYHHPFIIKTNANGDTLWTRNFGVFHQGGPADFRPSAPSAQQTSDGGFILVGGYGHDVLLGKTDTSGNTIWTRTHGGDDYEVGYDVGQTADSGYIIVGKHKNINPNILLIKTDAGGQFVWGQRFSGFYSEAGYAVEQTAEGGYIITGYTTSSGAGSADVWLIKTDDQGDTLWTRTFGGSEWDEGRSIQQTTDGGYIIAGYTTSTPDFFGNTHTDAYVIKTDDGGDTLWTQTFGGNSDDEAYSVRQTTDGGYIITGYTKSFGAGYKNVWLIRLGPEAPVAVEPEGKQTPHDFALYSAYPNPFNPSTAIAYDLPQAGPVALVVYDLRGREVIRLAEGRREAGYHQVSWAGRDAAGREVPTGIYIARLTTPGYAKSVKMVMMK